MWFVGERLPAIARVARYLVAGGSAAAINLGLLYVLTEYAHLWYLLSSFIAVSAAVVASFVLQKFWAFQDSRLDRIRVQLPQHAFLSIVNIALNAVLLYVLVEWVHVWYMAAQFVTSALLAVLNYFVYRTYIFRG